MQRSYVPSPKRKKFKLNTYKLSNKNKRLYKEAREDEARTMSILASMSRAEDWGAPSAASLR